MRILHILTHVASQICNRWIPPPLDLDLELLGLDGFGHDSDEEISMVSREEWLKLIQLLVKSRDCGFSWLRCWLKKYDRQGSLLADLCWGWIRDVQRNHGKIITFSDVLYPESLSAIQDPPLAFCILGNSSLFKKPCFAIVGSRQASNLALRESFLLGSALASRGFVVVSGGAIGCDIAAHRGVLASRDNKGHAIIVLPGGLGSWYPRCNFSWFRLLLDEGAVLLSERLWMAGCRKFDFPARNRIISGLSRKIFVMQSATKSGAMITARLALDQGRDVIVLRHPAGDLGASGNAGLMMQGADAFISAGDIIGDLV